MVISTQIIHVEYNILIMYIYFIILILDLCLNFFLTFLSQYVYHIDYNKHNYIISKRLIGEKSQKNFLIMKYIEKSKNLYNIRTCI